MAKNKRPPRLYITSDLNDGEVVILDRDQSHHVGNVLRKAVGDEILLFNGKDGEWSALITSVKKKEIEAEIKNQTRIQQKSASLTLIFAPIKKQRLDFMIEKAVELGVTDFYPVNTQHAEINAFKAERVKSQIIEACAQCERLDVPVLHPLSELMAALKTMTAGPICAAIERLEAAKDLKSVQEKDRQSFLIGPEGGFSEREKQLLKTYDNIIPVTLGPRILRAETAALYCLSHGSDNTA